MGERGRGALLYAGAALLVLGGGAWFVVAAPRTGADPRVSRWMQTAARALPDQPLQIKSETMVVINNMTGERTDDVDGGSYSLSMVCLGDGGQVRVRLSSNADDDSGRGVPCTGSPATVTLSVALATQFYMFVSGENLAGTAVFRWRLDRARA